MHAGRGIRTAAGERDLLLDQVGRPEAQQTDLATRTRSRSSADASAARCRTAAGLSAGSASSGAMIGHFSALSAAGGRPEPNVDSCPVQSMRLNQSPEL